MVRRLLSLAFILALTAPAQAADDPPVIGTNIVKDKLGKPGWTIVDARVTDAFNGWPLSGLPRGGHLPGAVDFSASWIDLRTSHAELLAERMAKKGIVPGHPVVVYDANGRDARVVAAFLRARGIGPLFTYDMRRWAKDPKLPMVAFPHHEKLVPASWVRTLVNGGKPEGYDGKGYKVFEVSWGSLAKGMSYLAGHIHGAVHINTDEVESAPLWSLNGDAALVKFAATNGITVNDTVVLYGPDVMAAYRLAAILDYLGVKDVRVLNGGLGVWKRAGYALEMGVVLKQPVPSFGAPGPLRKRLIVDLAGAKAAIADRRHACLVDIRSRDERLGKVSGYRDMDRKGRPAGSVWGKAGTKSVTLEDYRNVDDTMRNGDEILAMWRELGIRPDKRLVFFCGSGWRAAEVQTYAHVLGVKDAALYSNGWYEWSLDKRNPTETGLERGTR